MRISTSLMFDTGTSRITDMQARLAKTQDQISTGRRILTPSDDPVGAAQALMTTQAQAANQQLGANRQNAKNSLSLEETTLQSVTGLIQDAQTLLVNAGNAGLSDQDRKYIATELTGIRDGMLQQANTRDGNGNYLFAGYQASSQPFAKTATGAAYAGDQGQPMLQVGPSRQIAISDSGSAVFQAIRNGNGTFSTAAAASNTGTGMPSTGSVTNVAALTSHNYDVSFSVAAGVTTYSVVDTTAGTTLSSGNAYTPGQSIAFDGMQFELNGDPANGDKFSVAPSANESIFTTLTNAINALSASTATPAARAVLSNTLTAVGSGLSNALDNVLTVRASVGIRLKELDTLDGQGDAVDMQYQDQLSQLQDLDYAQAISDLSKQKLVLEAAQQVFTKTSGLSLFNYM